MTERYYNFLLTEITRVQKIKGTNIKLKITLNNKEIVLCNCVNKPILDSESEVLQIIEPYTEPTTLSDTQGGTKVITKTSGLRRHFALSEIVMVEILFDIIEETEITPIIPNENEEI